MIEETHIIDLVSGRYDTCHTAGNVKFFLPNYLPDIEECKFLLLKVVEQSVRDYVSLADSIEPDLQEVCKEARDFIFDDDYYIDWGDKQLNLPMILELLEIDTEWFRGKARKKLLEKDEI